MSALPDATRSALEPLLDPTERIIHVAAAVGCTLVLTDTRLHLVRDGVNYRPRTGIQSWVLDRSLTIRLTPVRQRTGRLIVARLGHNASVFLMPTHASDVETLLAELRRRIYSTG